MKNAGSRRHFFLVWLFAHRGVDGYAVHAFKRLKFEHCGVVPSKRSSGFSLNIVGWMAMPSTRSGGFSLNIVGWTAMN